jgi:acetylornithine/succinyldiaminopimelate/putrescine aminotransferase
MYMYGSGGKKYLDLISGIAVSNLGHSHPGVVKAVREQAERYMHLMVYGEFIEYPQVAFAKRLTEFLPGKLDNVFFTNSGAEATEGAMKLAKRATGRSQFISFQGGYHGSTQGALSIMGDEHFKRKFRPLLPGISQLEFNNVSDLEKISCRTAAVIVEFIQAESGVTVASKKFIGRLREKCDETGVLLIADEAQTGFGRTGKMFAFEHYGIIPDILLLAKALGGGMPLGAFIASKALMSALSENPALGHISTFGGHPVSCAAGLAAFEIMLRENLAGQVEEKGKLFEDILVHPKIRSKKRAGLMMALEFDSFEMNKKIIDRCIESGVVTDWFLFAPQCMRIAPPLIIKEEEIKFACKVIRESINES